jgi:serine/threonine protein kinase
MRGPNKRANQGRSPLYGLAQKYTMLNAGGNACVLKANDNLTILRISNASYDRAVDQQRLHEQLPWFVPHVSIVAVYNSYKAFYIANGDELVDLMEEHDRCVKNVLTKLRTNDSPIMVSQMEFINGTTLRTFSRQFPNDKDLRLLMFQILAGLYVLQRTLGFEHGDLNGSNILVAVPGDNGARFTAKLIDFDFIRFFTATPDDVNADRQMGSLDIAPIEFTGARTPAPVRLVRGALDIWALGINLLSIKVKGQTGAFYVTTAMANYMLGENFQPYAVVDKKTEHQILQHFAICAIHSLLSGHSYDRYAPPKVGGNTPDWTTARTRVYVYMQKEFKGPIDALDDETKEILRRMMHINPFDRTFNKNVARYFDMPYFDGIEDKERLLETLVRSYLAQDGRRRVLPPIGNNMTEQIRNLHRLNLAKCGDCSNMPHYLDAQRKRLVCEDCALKKNE